MDISVSIQLFHLKFSVYVKSILPMGFVSHICYLALCYVLCQKNY